LDGRPSLALLRHVRGEG